MASLLWHCGLWLFVFFGSWAYCLGVVEEGVVLQCSETSNVFF